MEPTSLFKFEEYQFSRFKICHAQWPHASHDFGTLTRDCDLNYNWWPPKDIGTGGFWTSQMLMEIAKKLDELNKPIDDEYFAYCEKWEEEHKNDKPDQF